MKYILVLLLLPFSYCNAQVILLEVKDSSRLQGVENAEVHLNDTFVGYTNNYGYFSLKINHSKSNKISVKHISYIEYDFEIINPKEKYIIELIPSNYELKPVVVEKKKVNKIIDFGKIYVTKDYLNNIPFILGEVDVLKSLQTFPGVNSSFEANSGLYIKGGNIDQTSIYLDDAPIYNMGHFYGFFSPFDNEALSSFTLYNSSVPSEYGSRGSNIVEVRFKEGNMKKSQRSFSLGLLSSKLLLEGPLAKNKSSYLASLRFAYPGSFTSRKGESKFRNNFVDGNIKLKFNINKNNAIYISTFSSVDVFSFSDINLFTVGNISLDKYKWSNNTATIRWNKINKDKSFRNTVLSGSKFNSRAYFLSNLEPDFGNQLINLCLKTEKDNMLNQLNINKVGFSTNFYHTSQAILYYNRIDTVSFKENIIPVNKAIEFVAFGNQNILFKEKQWKLENNLRLGFYYNFNDLSHDIIFEPRIKITRLFKEKEIFLSLDKNSQYQNFVGNRQVLIPSDFWIQSNKLFKPQKIYSVTSGFKKRFKSFNGITEVFYNKFLNALDLKDGAKLFRNKQVLNDITNVEHQSFGFQLLLEKSIKKLQGHLSYTFSRSIRRSPIINNNEWYASNYDRPHVFNLVTNYIANKKWSFGGLFILQNGTPVTANYAFTFLYSKRNEYRLPNYFRLDLSVTKKFKFTKRLYGEWNISVFNVLFAKNRTSQYPILDTYSSIPTLPSFNVKIYL